ncbi:MAG: homoserine kinase, partial [Bacillota bacterium]
MFEIRVPATSANLGPGFDCLGFAIQIYNKFKIEKTKSGFETEIFDIYSGKKLYLNIEENLFYHALNKVCDYTGKSLDGIKLTEEVNIPFARGLGSSASAVVAGLLAGNFLLGDIVSEGDLINLAVEMEGHPDNVLPAFKGGFIINVIDDQKLVYKRIDINSDINFVIAIPDFKLKTEDVRKVLPDKVSYRDAVFNLSRTAML